MLGGDVVAQRKAGRSAFGRIEPNLPAWARRVLGALRQESSRDAQRGDDHRHPNLIAERAPG